MTPAALKSALPIRAESFAEWMARADMEVAMTAAAISGAEKKIAPSADFSYERLHPAQRRIVQMVVELLQGLPRPLPGNPNWDTDAYGPVRRILRELFLAKYPTCVDERGGSGLQSFRLMSWRSLSGCSANAPADLGSSSRGGEGPARVRGRPVACCPTATNPLRTGRCG
jgi:hypothetical protein